MRPVVSVIYVNYNTSALLLQSVRSLVSNCCKVSMEIIVVDNGSSAGEIKALAALPENVVCIFSDQNLGFAGANNSAAGSARGRYLFFLNPDTLIVNDVISIFCDFLESSVPDIVACGGSLFKPDMSPNDSYGNFPGLRQELAMTGLGFRFFMKSYAQRVAIAASAPQNMMQVDYLVGADIFIRKASFNRVGGFDENYFLYYEETDLFKKLAGVNQQCFIIPQAEIIHFEGGSLAEKTTGKFNLTKFRHLLKSKLYYHRKWFRTHHVFLLKGILYVQIVAQFLKGNMGPNLQPLLNALSESIKSTPSPTKATADNN